MPIRNPGSVFVFKAPGNKKACMHIHTGLLLRYRANEKFSYRRINARTVSADLPPGPTSFILA